MTKNKQDKKRQFEVDEDTPRIIIEHLDDGGIIHTTNFHYEDMSKEKMIRADVYMVRILEALLDTIKARMVKGDVSGEFGVRKGEFIRKPNDN